MPIKPENRNRYPRDWKQIVAGIRERSGGRCECRGECRLHHGRRCSERNGQPAKYARGRIVLTVAHLDHCPEHCDPSNLRDFCQRCHLRYDANHHSINAAKTRDAKRGQTRFNWGE